MSGADPRTYAATVFGRQSEQWLLTSKVSGEFGLGRVEIIDVEPAAEYVQFGYESKPSPFTLWSATVYHTVG